MTDEQILRACAWRVRRFSSPSLTRDDVVQEGRIAIWMARRDGRVPTDQTHAERYLLRRVLGAMIDAHRNEWKQRPPSVEELTDANQELSEAQGQPDAMLEMRQALKRVISHGSPGVVRCVELLAGGASISDAALAMDVSESRISQLRKRAREIASPCW